MYIANKGDDVNTSPMSINLPPSSMCTYTMHFRLHINKALMHIRHRLLQIKHNNSEYIVNMLLAHRVKKSVDVDRERSALSACASTQFNHAQPYPEC